MLTAEENERLCRVEGGAPMGQLMRRHWIPALLSEEVRDVDGTPAAVRLFGEDFPPIPFPCRAFPRKLRVTDLADGLASMGTP